MSIRVKLLISYIAMLVIPSILTVIAAIVILVGTLGNVGHGKLGPDFLKEISERAIRISNDIDRIVSTDPDKLLDTKYLDSLDKELIIINTGIVVKKGSSLIYVSKMVDSDKILSKLPKPRNSRKDGFDGIAAGNKSYTVKMQDFTFTDKAPGSVFLITDISPVGHFAQKYFSSLMLAILIIVLLTNGVITYLVSRSIIRPLNMLKYGTKQIKEGNLNFEVRKISNDEIGQLCIAFEEMRRKLKASIELQMQYEENRKELISSISHDLKTPVTSIKGYVEGIMDGVADSPEKMEKYIRTIYSKAMDLDRLIDDLFLFSKLDLKKLPFNFEKVNIKKYFEDYIDESKTDFDNKGIRLDFRCDYPEDVEVLADREKLKRVVVNITENAVKYMDKDDGKVGIYLYSEQETVKVRIEDNGQGISKEDLPFIFDRFYRADPSRNVSTGGSGLGLAIAKQIVEGHGGRIWAESDYGKGTSINFTLKKV